MKLHEPALVRRPGSRGSTVARCVGPLDHKRVHERPKQLARQAQALDTRKTLNVHNLSIPETKHLSVSDYQPSSAYSSDVRHEDEHRRRSRSVQNKYVGPWLAWSLDEGKEEGVPQSNSKRAACTDECRELALADSSSTRKSEQGVFRRLGVFLELRDRAETESVTGAINVDARGVLPPVEGAEHSPHLCRVPS